MASPLDRLTLLETFVRICERGSISAASRDLGVSQATASRQLADLEARLGSKLIERTTHNLTITEVGRTVLDDARAILSGWEGMTERLEVERDSLAGPIKILLPTALGRAHLHAAAIAFIGDHPKVTLSVALDDSPGSAVDAGYDILVQIGRPNDDSLIVTEIASVTRLPMASTKLLTRAMDHPNALRALPFAALGPFEGAIVPLGQAKTGEAITLRLQPAIATNDIFGLRDAIISGQAWGVLPTWLVAKDMSRDALKPCLKDWAAPTLNITLSFPPSRRSIRRVRALADHLADVIRRLPSVRPVK